MSDALHRFSPLHARPVRRLFAFVLVVLMLSQLAVAFLAWSAAQQHFLPELERKAQTVSLSLANKITRALGYGIALDKLVGVEEFFADVRKQNADLAFLALTDPQGKVLFRSGNGEPASRPGDPLNVSVDVLVEGGKVGQIHVGVDPDYIATRVAGLRYDIAIILITSLLMAFEVLLFLVTLNLSAPVQRVIQFMARMSAGDFRQGLVAQSTDSLVSALNRMQAGVNQAYAEVLRLGSEPLRRAAAMPLLESLQKRFKFAAAGESAVAEQRLVAVRILTGIFMFAEMLSRPFLPLYAGAMSDHGLGLSEGLRASLPITAFLLGVALSMPMAGRWSDLVGRRRSYMAGALLVAAGLACASLVPEYFVFVLARAGTGVGYALMYMACQGFVLDNTDESSRGRGFAMFVSAISIAEICAPAIGGVLADRIGYRAVFMVGACFAALAAVMASVVLKNLNVSQSKAAPTQRLRLSSLAGNYRFWTLAVLSGIPAKLLFTGFFTFLVPVLLSGFGNSQSEIGRSTMIYGFISVALGPVFAYLAERFKAHALLVGVGGLFNGAGLLAILFLDGQDAVLCAIAAVGLGQSMSISSQLVLVTRVTQKQARLLGAGQIVGLFRLMERLGAAAGPLLAGALLTVLGASQAMLALGGLALVASLLFSLAYMLTGRAPDKESPA